MQPPCFRRTVSVIATLCCLLSAPGAPVFSGTTSTSLGISTIILANCNMSGGSINFGNYDPLVANAHSALVGSGTFTLACTKGTNAILAIDDGLSPGRAAGTSRAMSAGNNYLGYDLYTAANLASPWTTTSTVSYLSPSKNTTSTLTVWGKIPPGQDVRGNLVYNDTVTVTANF